jgi:hypothetical protein
MNHPGKLAQPIPCCGKEKINIFVFLTRAKARFSLSKERVTKCYNGGTPKERGSKKVTPKTKKEQIPHHHHNRDDRKEATRRRTANKPSDHEPLEEEGTGATDGRKGNNHQGSPYRSGRPNRRPSVTVYRPVSRGYRSLSNKFKFSNPRPVQSVRYRFTDRFGPVTDRLER